MSKPKLTIHPGFAKCATTSLQTQCQKDDFYLCRSRGIEWLGRTFKPFNGAPPVYDVVAGSKSVEQMLKDSCFESNRHYFVSAENLINHLDVVEMLQRKFLLETAVCTVRMPLFIALSEFYFRGWLNGSIEDAINPGVSSLQVRLERKLKLLQSKFGGKVGLCPIEQHDFISDFFIQCFDSRLSGAERLPRNGKQRRNSSAHPCFVIALSQEFSQLVSRGLDPLARRRLIRIVQQHSVATELNDYMPEEILVTLKNTALISNHVKSYLHWLSEYRCPEHKLDEVREHIESKISLDSSKRPCPNSTQAALRVEARELLVKAGMSD